MSEEVKKKTGRPKHRQLTQQELDQATLMMLNGVPLCRIAENLNLNVSTFKHHYAGTVTSALDKRNAFVANQLFKLIKKRDITAIIFYLKTQCNWKNKEDYELKKLDHELKKEIAKATLNQDKQQEKIEVVVKLDDSV